MVQLNIKGLRIQNNTNILKCDKLMRVSLMRLFTRAMSMGMSMSMRIARTAKKLALWLNGMKMEINIYKIQNSTNNTNFLIIYVRRRTQRDAAAWRDQVQSCFYQAFLHIYNIIQNIEKWEKMRNVWSCRSELFDLQEEGICNIRVSILHNFISNNVIYKHCQRKKTTKLKNSVHLWINVNIEQYFIPLSKGK